MTTLTEHDVAELAGSCPGCGKPFPARLIDEETLAACNRLMQTRGALLGPSGTWWCQQCLWKDTSQRVADMKARQDRQWRQSLHGTGAWDYAMQAMTFEQSEPRIEKRADSNRRDVYGQLRDWSPAQGNVWLWSRHPGAGKTYLAACLANRLLERGVEPYVLTATALTHLAKGYDSGEKLKRPCEAGVLLLDDVDKAELTEQVGAALLTILDYRHTHKLPTLCTANRKRSEVYELWRQSSQLGQASRIHAALDRLSWPGQDCASIEITGRSLRGEQAAQRELAGAAP